MEQQQFKIRVSISTKLIIAISLLLSIPIIFLNFSAARLFLEDKRAYIYDSQATACVLTGREFVTYLSTAMNTLKIALGSDKNRNTLSYYLENQDALIGLQLIDGTSVQEVLLPKATKHFGADGHPKPFELQKKSLETNRFYFTNLTAVGLEPTLEIVVSSPNTHVIARGFLDTGHFSGTTTSSFNKFMIGTKSGEILFHSEQSVLYSPQKASDHPIFNAVWASSVRAGAQEFNGTDGVAKLGSYYKPGLDLVVISEIDKQKALAATYTLTERLLTLALAALGIMIILALIFSKRLTRPILRLFGATKQVATGDFNVKLPVSSNDEIGALTKSFVAMSGRISELILAQMEKVRVDKEIEIARTVQQSLFPATAIDNDDLRFVAHYESASECGGDWLGFFSIGRQHVVIIADATGHGLPSALMTAAARSCFSVIEREARLSSRAELDPAAMLATANRVVYDSAKGKIMMTMFAAVINCENNTVRFASAAHNPPWVFGQKIKSLVATGERLGEAPEMAKPAEAKEVSFEKGTVFVFYTDGLTEGMNTSRQQYGKKQAREIIENTFQATQGNDAPERIVKDLVEDFKKHLAGKVLDDDVTLAVVQIR